jgi:ketosteroid isomerase-like protein
MHNIPRDTARAMSQENVEIVRRLYDAIARHDVAAVLSLYDPVVEADFSQSPQGGLIGGALIYHGHEGVRRMSRDWNEAWADVAYDIEELIDAGEHVISALTYRGRGRSSRAEVEQTDYPVWTMRDGRIVRVVWHTKCGDALEAAGLSED